jgi:hypothetical protein
MKHLTANELEAGLPHVLDSPKDGGILKLIVQRPAVGERVAVKTGFLSMEDGLVGDSWKSRGGPMTGDGSPHRDMQLNIMNARAAALVAEASGRWQLAGDQLYIDLDLSQDNLPSGTRLAIGSAIVEVTPVPHTGCRKFVERFGIDAMKFVNSELGRQHNLRGINARVVSSGVIAVGDVVSVVK